MEVTIQRLLDDLNTIAKIGIGDKIGISTDTLDIQREGMRQSLLRSFNGDHRNKSIAHIFNVINTSIALISLMRESEQSRDCTSLRYHQMRGLLDALSRSRDGLKNLQITYHNDGMLLISLREMDIIVDKITLC